MGSVGTVDVSATRKAAGSLPNRSVSLSPTSITPGFFPAMPSFRKEKQHTIAAIEASTIAHQRAWSFCTADGHHANLEAVTQADANRLSLVTRNEGDIFSIGALRIKIGARGELIGVG